MEFSCDVCMCVCVFLINHLQDYLKLGDTHHNCTRFYEQRASTFATPKYDSTPMLHYSTCSLLIKLCILWSEVFEDFMSKEQVLLPVEYWSGVKFWSGKRLFVFCS